MKKLDFHPHSRLVKRSEQMLGGKTTSELQKIEVVDFIEEKIFVSQWDMIIAPIGKQSKLLTTQNLEEWDAIEFPLSQYRKH